MIKVFLCVCLCLLPQFACAHEGHEHGAPLAVSVAFDAKGQLWRVSAKGGVVLVDYSTDMAKSFSNPVNINTEPQKIGLDGDARPKIAIAPNGNIYLTWTQALPKPYTGYIWFARSTNGGKSFEKPAIVHTDRAEITHRFDALAVANSGRIYIAWVDKRDLESAKVNKTQYDGAAVYYTVSDDQGASFKPEQKLADNSCECCRIALGTTQDGQAVGMWRHLFEGGVRDHAMMQFGGVGASTVHRASFGNWKIDACPHHGPAIARGDQSGKTWGWHMAWFDGASDTSKVGLYYARMDSETWVSSPARRFGDALQQAGHPALLSQGEQVWLAWKELNESSSLIKMAVSNDGGRNWQEAKEVAQTAGKSDYPQLLSKENQVYLAWNTEKEGFRLLTLGSAP
jgi:hypothetical protein